LPDADHNWSKRDDGPRLRRLLPVAHVASRSMAAREAPGPTERSSADDEFGAALRAIRHVGGYLSPEQARRLWDCARALAPGSSIVEIGSFHGRSTIVLARACPEGAAVIAVDPHAGSDRLPQTGRSEPDEGRQDFVAFHDNLRRAGVAGRVRHVRLCSLEALGAVVGKVDLLFVDGAHRYTPCRADIERWGGRVAPGGTMFIHDAFNATGVTMAQARTLLLSTDWRYCGRVRSLAEYRRESLPLVASLRNALRQLAQLGYFVRSLTIKAALAQMPRVAHLLGHRIDGWPH
jgi:predicted O-methyltransferase YrrM